MKNTQNNFDYRPDLIQAIEHSLSLERLMRYTALTKGDPQKRLRLYLWNAELSAAMYTPLQGLEVILRNALHSELSTVYGPTWFDNQNLPFLPIQAKKLQEAKMGLARLKRPILSADVVATLPLGFWVPMPEQSVDWDSTENLIIEGDNLEVLKLLQKPYHGKVKMIYIDPPYNTGNEFIYPDNFREGLDDYLRYSGQVSEAGIKQSTNTETSGRFHSKWLNMMYPRLFLARNLLRDDGVIFVSIDDHEVHNLRMLMNEVFGEENFIANIVWQKNNLHKMMQLTFLLCTTMF